MKHKLFLFIATLGMLLPQVGGAQTLIYGIYYHLNSTDQTAEVTRMSLIASYTGSIVIPQSVRYENVTYKVTSIGPSAFDECQELTSVTIPNSVKSIGSYAFTHCSKLTSIIIPSSVGSIGKRAFYGCTGLTSIIVKAETPPSVGEACFHGVDKTIPVCTAANAYKNADGWNEFKNIIPPYEFCGIYYILFSDGTAEVIKSPDKYTGAIDILETVSYGDKTYSVTSIGDFAFYDCSGLTSVTIPCGVTSIGDSAFYYCTGLTSITIEAETPPSVGYECFDVVDYYTIPVFVPSSTAADAYKTAVGWHWFRNFVFRFPYEFDGIYYDLFSDGTARVIASPDKYTGAIDIPETVSHEGITYNVTSIGERAFFECEDLTCVTIPRGVTSIGKEAFAYCTKLSAVTIPNSVVNIGEYAFLYCHKLSSISIASSVKSIGRCAFYECTGLASIIVEAETPPAVGNACFFNVNKDIPVYLPSSTATDAYKAEDGWKDFRNLVFPYEFGGIYYNLFSGGTAEVIANPDKYTGAIEIPETVSLGDITYNVTSIGEKAFYNCNSLTSVTIPSSVTSIAGNAFSGCTRLKSITIRAEAPPSVGEDCFLEVDKTIPVYVPSSTAAKVYRAADGWKEFTNIIYHYTLEDKTKYTESKGFKADELIYTRTFSNTEWQALYVPFSMEYDEWKDKLDVYDIYNVLAYDEDNDGEIERTTVNMIRMKEGAVTEPNYPYVVRAKNEGNVEIKLTDATLYPAEENAIDCTSTKQKFTFTGTYETKTGLYTAGYYALSDGILKTAIDDNVPLNPQRWYMEVTNRNGSPATATRVYLNAFGEEEVEGVKGVTVNIIGEETTYDLNGRTVNAAQLPKGLYVRGSKKIIVK